MQIKVRVKLSYAWKVPNKFCRDRSIRITYKLVSESIFSKRHSLTVRWSRELSPVTIFPVDGLMFESDPTSFRVEMISIACPDTNQSEAFISTVALYMIFASQPEQKLYMRLPSVWRDLWEELSILDRGNRDANDRETLRELRTIIENIGNSSDLPNGNVDDFGKGTVPAKYESDQGKPQPLQQSPMPSINEFKAIWAAKERTPSYQQMLSSRMKLPVYNFKRDLLLAIADRQVVIICGETGCGKSTQGKVSDHVISTF